MTPPHFSSAVYTIRIREVEWRIQGGMGPAERRRADTIQAFAFTNTLSSSDFRPGIVSIFQMVIRADGYVPILSGQSFFSGDDIDEDFALKRDSPVRRTVQKPDGSSASWPEIYSGSTAGGPGRPFYPVGDRSEYFRVESGPTGAFDLGDVPNEDWVLITDPGGVFFGTAEEIRATNAVRLQATGAIHGTAFSEGKPASHLNLSINRLPCLGSWVGLGVSRYVTTDSTGEFAVNDLPPGAYIVSRSPTPTHKGRIGGFSHAMTVLVREGTTTNVTYGGTGRTITGRLVLEPGAAAVNWSHDSQWLIANEGGPASRRQIGFGLGSIDICRGDYISRRTYEKAARAKEADVNELLSSVSPKRYLLDVEADGRFRGEDVPPGTYDLCARVTETVGQNSYVVVAETIQQVVVPKGTDPWDAGTTVVPRTQRLSDE